MVSFFFPSIGTAGQPESALRSLQRHLKWWWMDVRTSVNPLIASGFLISPEGGSSITRHWFKSVASETESAFVCQTYHVTFQGLLEPRRPPAPLSTRTWIRLGCSARTRAHNDTSGRTNERRRSVHAWMPACTRGGHNEDSSMCIALSHLKVTGMFRPVTKRRSENGSQIDALTLVNTWTWTWIYMYGETERRFKI